MCVLMSFQAPPLVCYNKFVKTILHYPLEIGSLCGIMLKKFKAEGLFKLKSMV